MLDALGVLDGLGVGLGVGHDSPTGALLICASGMSSLRPTKNIAAPPTEAVSVAGAQRSVPELRANIEQVNCGATTTEYPSKFSAADAGS